MHPTTLVSNLGTVATRGSLTSHTNTRNSGNLWDTTGGVDILELLDLEAELLKNADYFTVLVHLLEDGVLKKRPGGPHLGALYRSEGELFPSLNCISIALDSMRIICAVFTISTTL